MDGIEALRQSTRWRLWVRGTQIEVPALAGTAMFGFFAAQRVPNAVAGVVLVGGLAITLVGFGMTMVSLPVLMAQNYAMFNGRQTAVVRAFLKDVLSLRKPPPPAEPPWPPPMRRP